MHVYSIEKKCSLVLEIFIWTDNIFKYFVNLSKHKWQLVSHFEFDPDKTSQEHSGRNVHWCWRYSSRQRTFSNILSIWANKNGNKSAILNLIQTKPHKIYGMTVINACEKYHTKMFNGVGDIDPNGQISDGTTGGRTKTQTDGAQIIIRSPMVGDK